MVAVNRILRGLQADMLVNAWWWRRVQEAGIGNDVRLDSGVFTCLVAESDLTTRLDIFVLRQQHRNFVSSK